MEKIDVAALHEIVRCDPDAGLLFWLERPASMFKSSEKRTAEHCAAAWNSKNAGKEALSAPTEGYKHGTIFGVKYRAHHVIWAMVHGAWPKDDIDHINGDRSDNRIENLRDVCRQENSRNASRSRNNKSGVTGVFWYKNYGMWKVEIGINYKNKCVGYFRSFDEAVAARRNAEMKHGFHENHGRAA